MRAAGRTDMTKPIVAFRNTNNASKNSDCVRTEQSVTDGQSDVRGDSYGIKCRVVNKIR